MNTDSYHSHHSPFGAFASFTIGLTDSQGGFGQALRGPAAQNVYIGYKQADQKAWQLLPYFQPSRSQEAAFTGVEGEATQARTMQALPADAFTRELGWCTDTWRANAGCFGFSLLTPVDRIADPTRLSKARERFHLAPIVCGWIEYDNRAGDGAVELVFGLGEPERPPRPLADSHPGLAGFATGTSYGYATRPAKGVSLRQGFDIFAPKFFDYRGLHVIGSESALVFTVPAGRRRRFPLVLGFYQPDQATTGMPTEYAFSRCFSGLEDALDHGLNHFSEYEKIALTRDRELARSGLDEHQRYLVAQSTHSYLGNTQLLRSGPEVVWVVNEGEYRMINTFDLTVDHLFYELAWHPWTVRNTLDLFVDRYAYTDRIKVGTRTVPGGLSFTHDMGVMNHFTPEGRSSYECDHLHGCFSHMTMEQLLNWVLTAVTYAEKTGDKTWLRRRKDVLIACAESMRRRDNPDPRKRDGILKQDSDRCGPDGSEITTYDSLDVSLGQARNNLYLAVKTLGAWILLERAFERLGLSDERTAARSASGLLASTLTTKFESDTGFFPAVFESGNRSRIIPAVEGFVYPLYLGITEALDFKGRFGPLLQQLNAHIKGVLKPGLCLDAKSGGWKMSSTSTNTWFSKIALSQYVVRQLFPEAMNAQARAADKVHADWQRHPGCGSQAMCDQILSDTGVTCGSRYYPRGVTSYLWLLE